MHCLARKTGFPSVASQLKALSLQIHAWRTLLAYQISAATIAVCFVALAQPDSRISLFKSTRQEGFFFSRTAVAHTLLLS